MWLCQKWKYSKEEGKAKSKWRRHMLEGKTKQEDQEKYDWSESSYIC